MFSWLLCVHSAPIGCCRRLSSPIGRGRASRLGAWQGARLAASGCARRSDLPMLRRKRAARRQIAMMMSGRSVLCVSAAVVAAAARWLAVRLAAGDGADAGGRACVPPCGLRAQAGANPRQFARHVRARPHPLRFLRQCLRRLCAAIPPGLGARQRRGQGHAQRPALDHLGRRRGQVVHLQVAELSQRDA